MTNPTIVSLSDTAELVRAVPLLLGFAPQDSVVVLAFAGRRLGPVMRINLPPGFRTEDQELTAHARQSARSAVRKIAGHLAQHARRHGDSAAIFVYSEHPQAAEALTGTLRVFLDRKLTIVDAATVAGTIAYPAPDRDGTPCPPIDVAGSDPATDELSAEFAGQGRSVLPNRAALAESVCAPTGLMLRQARKAVRQIRATHRVPWSALDVLANLAEHRHPGDDLDMYLACELALALQDHTRRDEAIAFVLSDRTRHWVALLISAVRQVPAEDSVDLCALLAVAAYRDGDGALAHEALERALAVHPDHRLSLLIDQMLMAGLPPIVLDEMAAELAEIFSAPDTV